MRMHMLILFIPLSFLLAYLLAGAWGTYREFRNKARSKRSLLLLIAYEFVVVLSALLWSLLHSHGSAVVRIGIALTALATLFVGFHVVLGNGWSGYCQGYRVLFRWSDEDKAYVATVPDLSGCMADGENMRSTRKNIEQAISLWLEVAKGEGRQIPPRIRF